MTTNFGIRFLVSRNFLFGEPHLRTSCIRPRSCQRSHFKWPISNRPAKSSGVGIA